MLNRIAFARVLAIAVLACRGTSSENPLRYVDDEAPADIQPVYAPIAPIPAAMILQRRTMWASAGER